MKHTLPLLALFAAPLAFAHPGHADTATFAEAFLHPLTGFDHLLAMLAVGFWSASLHRHAGLLRLLSLPAAFVAFLLAGVCLGQGGLSLPAVEPMIAASLLVLGIAAALGRQISQPTALFVVAVFAIFHGHAHGAELGSSLAALLGITLSTALLHLGGIGLGMNAQVRRAGGALVATSGALLLLQMV